MLLYKYRCEELHAAHHDDENDHSVHVQVKKKGEEVGSDQKASVTLAVARQEKGNAKAYLLARAT